MKVHYCASNGAILNSFLKILGLCKSQPFFQKSAENSQILSFWWNGYHILMKVYYCASKIELFPKKSGLLQKSSIFAKISQNQSGFEFLMKWLSFLNESPLSCIEWCYIKLFPKKVWASAKISHFCKNQPKNSQILSFWWKGWQFWMKIHYCASNGAILNFFLKKSGPLQESAIFAKIGPKNDGVWVFDEMANNSGWKFIIACQMVYWTLS